MSENDTNAVAAVTEDEDTSRKRKADDISNGVEKGSDKVIEEPEGKSQRIDDNSPKAGQEDATQVDGGDVSGSSSSKAVAPIATNDDATATKPADNDPKQQPSSEKLINDKEFAPNNEEDKTTAATAATAIVADNTTRPKNEYDNLRWIVVRNDNRPESMIKLIGLKSLFAKQLPKMPRAYIARLVLDRRHTSLAILSDKPELKDSDDEIIGGICYRAFPEMRFAEIAFCAVNGAHQVRGYGSKLMNLLKKLAVETGIENFITYADNYAIGYFKKQGFSKSISMPKGRYAGLIKEYDGGTPMECYVHPTIDFTRIPEMIQAQRNYILDRIRLTAGENAQRVYDALPKSFYEAEASSRGNHVAARAMSIPGIAEAGWTLADMRNAMGQAKEVDRMQVVLKADLLSMLRRVEEQQFAWPFREPVDTKEVPDYLEVIKQPIDLSTIEKKIRQDNYYRTKEMFFADLILMVNNCKTYNEDTSTYVQCAKKLEKFVNDKLK